MAQPFLSLPGFRLLAGLLLAGALALPAHAATWLCVTTAMRGNKWICIEEPGVCSFVFTVDEQKQTMTRRADERNKKIPVIVDKWTDQVVIAHEDLTRIDSRFIEQYFYKIERDTGNFLMANEYRTNSGRYLTQEELNMADKKRYSYFRPLLFSEKGRCRFKRGK